MLCCHLDLSSRAGHLCGCTYLGHNGPRAISRSKKWVPISCALDRVTFGGRRGCLYKFCGQTVCSPWGPCWEGGRTFRVDSLQKSRASKYSPRQSSHTVVSHLPSGYELRIALRPLVNGVALSTLHFSHGIAATELPMGVTAMALRDSGYLATATWSLPRLHTRSVGWLRHHTTRAMDALLRSFARRTDGRVSIGHVAHCCTLGRSAKQK